MPLSPEPDTLSCPLCGQPNGCAIAAGRAPESCWCMAQVVNPAALERVPQEQRGVACICPACGAPGLPRSYAATGAEDAAATATAVPGGPPI